ncbi:MAG TPA: prepilin-type N-terminal cleavage/methylation domain-containing protein [Chthoniobacteraceae bacterium]|jgi:prepilin-type N-terminal cleavage/methylation domain-containing protein|nr:prepilin-type N-terminal cleavage/methylation domain-containing protein [Chthoniobacteraceae bacterium]
MKPSRDPRSRGFTLVEIITVISVIAILAMLSFPVFAEVRAHIERINCTSNLVQLYTGASAYLQDTKHWPQVNPALLNQANHAYDEAWIETYMPYGVTRQCWICPTIERSLGGPDITQPENYRADYIAMPYDSKQLSPHQWPLQPWFAERGNVHGTGNLIILANGSVTDLYSLAPAAAAASGL